MRVALPLTLALAACAHAPSGIDAGPRDVSAPVDVGTAPDVTPPVPDGGTDAGPPPAPLFLRDAQGRALILHGANVDGAAKDTPDHSPTITAGEADHMAHVFGFNFARYLIFWDGLEPTPGTIDTAYLDRIQGYLDLLAANGISVMLDMHQDVYSAAFCCDGAPMWAIRDDGLSFMLQSQWSANYFQPAVTRAFDNFWSYMAPNQDLQDHYANVWMAVATRFHDHPAVVGFDLINEPYPGSAFDPVEAATGVGHGPNGRAGVFDRTVFAAFYQRMIDRIRTVDTDHWIFVEPRYGAAAAGAENYLPALTDPRTGDSHVAYAPHLYSVAYEATSSYSPSDRTVARWEASRTAERYTFNAPTVIGEYGVEPGYPGADQYTDDILSMADRMMLGWSYWSFGTGGYSAWDPTTGVENVQMQYMVRTYPQRVAGDPQQIAWDVNTHVMTLQFTDRAGTTGPTVIFVPERFYPTGYAVDVLDAAASWSQTFDAPTRLLSVQTPVTGGMHQITVRPM